MVSAELACTILSMFSLTVPRFEYCIIKLFDNLLSKHEHSYVCCAINPVRQEVWKSCLPNKKPYQSNWTEASIAMWQILCSHDIFTLPL